MQNQIEEETILRTCEIKIVEKIVNRTIKPKTSGKQKNIWHAPSKCYQAIRLWFPVIDLILRFFTHNNP